MNDYNISLLTHFFRKLGTDSELETTTANKLT